MKFSSKPVAQHQDAPLSDNGKLEAVIASWQAPRLGINQQSEQGNISYVVCLTMDGESRSQGKPAEILGLLDTLNEPVCGHQSIHLHQPNPKTLLGSGKLNEIAGTARECGANMLVLDAKLTPSQTRNIEMQTGFAVCDREATILNVFLKHAKTRAAKVQVEIAQLQYLKPRIRGIGLNMDQQAGGIGASRGAGETASQLLARRLDKRILQLQKSADNLARTGANQRQGRAGTKQIALVGYTNAGKTSLMNALTEADLSARNAPFETLDTTTRLLSDEPGRQVLLSDTVGFIRELPETLLASFESTLAQAREADLLAIVMDISDPEHQLHLETTLAILRKLGCDDIPKFFIFNKMDKVYGRPFAPQYQSFDDNEHICVSSHDGESVKRLHRHLIDLVSTDMQRTKMFVRHNSSAILSKLYASCKVLKTEANASGTLFSVEATPAVCNQLKSMIKGGS